MMTLTECVSKLYQIFPTLVCCLVDRWDLFLSFDLINDYSKVLVANFILISVIDCSQNAWLSQKILDSSWCFCWVCEGDNS